MRAACLKDSAFDLGDLLIRKPQLAGQSGLAWTFLAETAMAVQAGPKYPDIGHLGLP